MTTFLLILLGLFLLSLVGTFIDFIIWIVKSH